MQICGDPQGFFRQTLRRLPLADAVVHLLPLALDDGACNAAALML